MIEIGLPDFGQLERDLRVSGDKVARAVGAEVRVLAFELVATIKDKKLSGQVLKVQSGRLRRSVNAKFKNTASGIDATVGTNVEYARPHEYGFKGTQTVKAHMRKGKHVRTHSRRVNIKERSFLRSAYSEMEPTIQGRIARAIAGAIVSGAR